MFRDGERERERERKRGEGRQAGKPCGFPTPNKCVAKSYEERTRLSFFLSFFLCLVCRGYIELAMSARGSIRTVGLPRAMTGLDNTLASPYLETDFNFFHDT